MKFMFDDKSQGKWVAVKEERCQASAIGGCSTPIMIVLTPRNTFDSPNEFETHG
jgi:hypothetical protein